jgi:interferon gamma-inducible protein 30
LKNIMFVSPKLFLAISLVFASSPPPAAAASEKVTLNFYGEALWPECGAFVGNELYPALTTKGISDIVTFIFYPFGNSYYAIESCPSGDSYNHATRMCWNAACNKTSAPSDCFSGTLICQHGQPECYANRVEACAIKLYPNVTQYLGFINCYESTNEPNNSTLQHCANQMSMKSSKLRDCASSDEGLALDSMNARATAEIPGGHASTPWPILNGNVVESGLLQAICSAYVGTKKPAACN